MRQQHYKINRISFTSKDWNHYGGTESTGEGQRKNQQEFNDRDGKWPRLASSCSAVSDFSVSPVPPWCSFLLLNG
jgi:hypothetical protein